jgi:hypothetical protein
MDIKELLTSCDAYIGALLQTHVQYRHETCTDEPSLRNFAGDQAIQTPYVGKHLESVNSKMCCFFLPCCSHTWERAPVSGHRADFTQFLNQDGR